MWLALLPAVAFAGRVVVEVRNPVVLTVNGALVESPPVGDLVLAEDVAGRLQVEARSALGEVLGFMVLDLPQVGDVQAVYEDGAFRVDAVRGGATLVASSPAPVRPGAPRGAARPAGPGVEAACDALVTEDGGARWVGSGLVEVDRPAPGRSGTDPRAQARALAQARAEAAEALRRRACPQDGPCDAAVTRLAWRDALVDGGRFACAVVQASPAEAARGSVVAPAAAPRAVRLLRQDDAWANVFVDGQLVAEFRVGDQEKVVPLLPGPHTVEIRDFMNKVSWARGVLTVRAGDGALHVGFGEARRVEVYNDPEAWR